MREKLNVLDLPGMDTGKCSEDELEVKHLYDQAMVIDNICQYEFLQYAPDIASNFKDIFHSGTVFSSLPKARNFTYLHNIDCR